MLRRLMLQRLKHQLNQPSSFSVWIAFKSQKTETGLSGLGLFLLPSR
jgi:hypothetical protein